MKKKLLYIVMVAGLLLACSTGGALALDAATVTPVTLTPEVATVESKTYDGNTVGRGTLTLKGASEGDTPTATGTFTWTDKAAGTSSINVTNITLDPEWTTNYTLSTTELSHQVVSASIAPRPADITWNYTPPFIYNGAYYAVIPQVQNTVPGDIINTITEGGSNFDAGNYTANVRTLTNRNYTLEGATGTSLNWKILTTVDFDPAGGTPAPARQTPAYDDPVIQPETITKEGYLFGGWYDDGRLWNFDIDLATQNKTTLTAHWIENPKALTSFTLNGRTGTINEDAGTIEVTLPGGTDLSALKATFSASAGATVKVGQAVQESGVTPNNFSSPMTYSVYSQHEPSTNPKNYTVTVKLLNPPVIGGIKDGHHYVTTQQAVVTGDAITEVTLNGNPVSTLSAADNDIVLNLAGNVDQSYTITATNTLGLESTATVTMAPITTLSKPIDTLNTDTVKSSDRPAIDGTRKAVQEATTPHATEEEIAGLKAITDQCDTLDAQINAVAQAIEAANKIAAGIKADNVQPGDKAALEASKAALEKVLADYPNNLTPKERQTLTERLQEIAGVITLVDYAQLPLTEKAQGVRTGLTGSPATAAIVILMGALTLGSGYLCTRKKH
ncbi:YDG domain-containing protein [Eubacterium barkeri]|uniref:Listeria/Bacterioides repeat-containing protein n=1 Tax=Eubacterium barkeri TaxID=1528 RepID=A0A1H3AKR6_EUBBA|nr:InlB B-repeat-containing protein [Eubacterium barkeri]SDX29764.1 Listeria/Bacterioides repeat-containing protein [Eubacterium barkeri]